MKKRFTKLIGLIAVFSLLIFISLPGVTVSAATTADITVTATPAYVAISCNCTTINFGVVTASVNQSTGTSECTIDNTSTVQTDQTIAANTTTWAGGVTWSHSETATPGSDTAGLLSNKGGTWGVGDIIIKNASPNYIAEDQAADTDYSFGIKLVTPTAFTDGIQKTMVVIVSAAQG